MCEIFSVDGRRVYRVRDGEIINSSRRFGCLVHSDYNGKKSSFNNKLLQNYEIAEEFFSLGLEFSGIIDLCKRTQTHHRVCNGDSICEFPFATLQVKHHSRLEHRARTLPQGYEHIPNGGRSQNTEHFRPIWIIEHFRRSQAIEHFRRAVSRRGARTSCPRLRWDYNRSWKSLSKAITSSFLALFASFRICEWKWNAIDTSGSTTWIWEMVLFHRIYHWCKWKGLCCRLGCWITFSAINFGVLPQALQVFIQNEHNLAWSVV